jgi:hypothetical protein
MRASRFLAFIVLTGGCFSGLDDSKLSGGSPPDLARSVGSYHDAGPVCDDFSADALGSLPPAWTAVSGSWKVIDVGGGKHALGQTRSTTTRVLAWMGTTGSDLSLAATVRPGASNATDCVITRYHDEQNYYGWCISVGTSWMLIKLKDGKSSTLDTGMLTYDTTQPHALIFTAVGTQLTGSVDGKQLSQQADTTFGRGGVALATDNKSSFAEVCVTPP